MKLKLISSWWIKICGVGMSFRVCGLKVYYYQVFMIYGRRNYTWCRACTLSSLDKSTWISIFVIWNQFHLNVIFAKRNIRWFVDMFFVWIFKDKKYIRVDVSFFLLQLKESIEIIEKLLFCWHHVFSILLGGSLSDEGHES